jgi:hypothetical protein
VLLLPATIVPRTVGMVSATLTTDYTVAAQETPMLYLLGAGEGGD